MAVNSFLQGFTGGMSAVNSMIDTADKKQYRQQLMEQNKATFQLKQEESNNVKAQRNTMGLMEVYKYVENETPEIKQKFNQDMFSYINDMPGVKDALAAEFQGGNAKLRGLEPTANGIVPMVSYTDKDGKEVKDVLRRDGVPLAIPQKDFYTMLGNTKLLDQATRLKATLVSRGGTAPKEYELIQKDGMLMQRRKGDNFHSVLSGKGSGSGTSDSDKRLSTFTDVDSNVYDTWRENGKIILRETAADGKKKQPRVITESYFNYLKQQGSVQDRMNTGMMAQDNNSIPPYLRKENAASDFERDMPDLDPRNIDQGMKPPDDDPATLSQNDLPESAPSAPSARSAMAGTQQQQLDQLKRQDTAQNISDYFAKNRKAARNSSKGVGPQSMMSNINQPAASGMKAGTSKPPDQWTDDEIMTQAKDIETKTQDPKALREFLAQFPEETIRRLTSRLAPEAKS